MSNNPTGRIAVVDAPVEKVSVSKLPRYSVSKSIEEVAAEYGLDSVVFLASNENPYGYSPKISSLMHGDMLSLNRYPDGAGTKLKASIAQKFSCHSENVVLGNGSNEVLECVAKAFLCEGDEVIVSDHSFAMYPLLSSAYGAVVRSVGMHNWHVDLDRILVQVNDHTKIVFIANANNPTGTGILSGKLKTFLDLMPKHVVVVIDEAYFEFSDPGSISATQWIAEYSNLVVSRTFSKAYGFNFSI